MAGLIEPFLGAGHPIRPQLHRLGPRWRRRGRQEEAGEAYRAALALTDNATERAFLSEQLD